MLGGLIETDHPHRGPVRLSATVLALGVALSSASISSVYAASVEIFGKPVDESFAALPPLVVSPSGVPNVDPASGAIRFYIPLTRDEIYGKPYYETKFEPRWIRTRNGWSFTYEAVTRLTHHGGLKQDSCSSGNCDGGSLTMFLKYDTLEVGNHLLTLDFTDLDLAGANDPAGFFESIEFFAPTLAGGWSTRGKITNVANAGEFEAQEQNIQLVSYNPDQQKIQALVNVQSSFYVAKLVLNVETNNFWSGTNLLESLLTTMVALPPEAPPPGPVPLPGALVLMGSALAGSAGFATWRKRRARGAAA